MKNVLDVTFLLWGYSRMSDFVYYYFCKKLSECSEMLIEMDISEEKRDELNN